jgi:hypothetical protein
MSKMTAGEWIRTVTPIVVLLATGLVGWVRLDARLEATVQRLDAEIARATSIDAAQDNAQRSTQLSVVEIKSDIRHIREIVDKSSKAQEEILRELRK